MASYAPDGEHIDIAIIGAGIGGAAAGVALQQAGFDVQLFEQAAELREVGGGIVIREPTMMLLTQWGILEGLRPALIAVKMMEIRDRNGTILATAPAAIENPAGSVYPHHRADIHNALVSKISPARLHLGHRVVSVENSSDHAGATFENGRRIRARLIVGADGLRSVVRTLIDATPISFLKQVTNRTIAPASILPPDMPNDRIRIWQDGMRRLIALPIRNGTAITLNAAIPAEMLPETSSMPLDKLLSYYTDFEPLVTRLIESGTAPITTHAVYDKEPIEQWSDSHIVLLGDAAHPMSPMNGQGANQAMQDAGALTAALTGCHRDNLTSALLEYQSIRAPATAHIQMLSRKPMAALVRSAPAAT